MLTLETSQIKKKKKVKKQCIMRDQTHKATKCNVVFAELGKYRAPGQERIKGSKSEEIFTRSVTPSHVATLH